MILKDLELKTTEFEDLALPDHPFLHCTHHPVGQALRGTRTRNTHLDISMRNYGGLDNMPALSTRRLLAVQPDPSDESIIGLV